MFRHKADEHAPSSAYARWFLVAGGAGFMNAAALVTLGNFVTHVTGFASLFGVHASHGDLKQALAALGVPLFFMAGAMLAGFLVVQREEKGLPPHYDVAMALAGLCALAPPLLSRAGLSGGFGERLDMQAGGSVLAVALLCMSSGIQNAALSAASHRSVRVTHLTGLTTDLGLGLARLLGGGGGPERKATLVRLGTLGSFLAGSLAGAMAAGRFGFDSFAAPAAVCFYSAWRGRTEKFTRS
jgi:uncharacterized membrane protein YoaK (UPF0700 family)